LAKLLKSSYVFTVSVLTKLFEIENFSITKILLKEGSQDILTVLHQFLD